MRAKKQEQGANQEANSQETKAGLKSLPQVSIPQVISVKQLADLLGVSAVDVIKQLMRSSIMANINQAIDFDTASVVAADFGYEATKQLAASQARVENAQYLAYGHSLIVDPWGTILAEAGEGEEIVYAELDSGTLTDTRKRMPLLDQRNPSLYKI